MAANKQHIQARILILDDEELNINLLERLLKQAGYKNILGSTDPTLATTLYSQYKPDLVLLDLNMPIMDGFEILRRLQDIEIDSYIPVMVLSANADDESRLKALDLGAMDFLNKPFNKLEVLSRIRNMLEVRLLHKELRHQNEYLEERIAERTKAVRDSQLEIVQRLGLASEFRDNETGKHIIRMSYYSEIIARHHGLSPAECDLILNASPMHDIGKLGIPDSILLKPAKLTREESTQMQSHTIIGANLLEDARSGITDAAQIIALSHHEKWDGSGYPHGLSGNDIPLHARIVAIADVFDALTSVRPYKRAWTVNDAVEEVKQTSGTHFDPVLVEKFIQALPEILEVKEKYSDELPGDVLYRINA